MLACLPAAGVPVAERRHGPGEGIYLRGDSDAGLCFLMGGAVRVYKPYGGLKEDTVRVLSGEGIFGEPPLDLAESHRDSAEAASPCRVAKVPKAPLFDYLARDPRCRLVEAPRGRRILVLDERGLGEVARGRMRGGLRSPDVVGEGFPETHPRAAINGRIAPKSSVPGYHGPHESGYGRNEPWRERSSSKCSAE